MENYLCLMLLATLYKEMESKNQLGQELQATDESLSEWSFGFAAGVCFARELIEEQFEVKPLN